MADELLVATRTFITTLDGHRTVVKKGKTRVRASHPLARKFGDAFKPADHDVPVVEDTRARPPAPVRRAKSDKD